MNPKDLPAFPTAYFGEGVQATGGMTLRDYFAAKAMQMPIIFALESARKGLPYPNNLEKDIAESAYKIADAMLAERSKP